MKRHVSTRKALDATIVFTLLCSALAAFVHSAPITLKPMEAHAMLQTELVDSTQPSTSKVLNTRSPMDFGNELWAVVRGHVRLPHEQDLGGLQPDRTTQLPSQPVVEPVSSRKRKSIVHDSAAASSSRGSAKPARAYPFWDDSKEASWAEFLDPSVTRADLASDDYDLRSAAWIRVYRNKAKAIEAGQAEARPYRQPGTAGFSEQDLDAIRSGDDVKLELARKRCRNRTSRLQRAEPPDKESRAWASWRRKMDEEEAVRATFSTAATKKQRIESTGGYKEKHPILQAGPTEAELELFRSQNIQDHKRLRTLISYRTDKGKAKVKRGETTPMRLKKLYADLVWKKGVVLRKSYSAEEIEEQIPKVLAAAHSMSSLDAIEQIPKLLTDLVSHARPKGASVQTHGSVGGSVTTAATSSSLPSTSTRPVAPSHPQPLTRFGDPSSLHISTNASAQHEPQGSSIGQPQHLPAGPRTTPRDVWAEYLNALQETGLSAASPDRHT